jgi:hypothetical protein
MSALKTSNAQLQAALEEWNTAGIAILALAAGTPERISAIADFMINVSSNIPDSVAREEVVAYAAQAKGQEVTGWITAIGYAMSGEHVINIQVDSDEDITFKFDVDVDDDRDFCRFKVKEGKWKLY